MIVLAQSKLNIQNTFYTSIPFRIICNMDQIQSFNQIVNSKVVFVLYDNYTMKEHIVI